MHVPNLTIVRQPCINSQLILTDPRILIIMCLLHCCFEGILGKMECLPVGYSETLTFWIQGQTSCPTYSVTVTVVPMVGR